MLYKTMPANIKLPIILIAGMLLLVGRGLALEHDTRSGGGALADAAAAPDDTDAAFLEWAKRQGIEAQVTLETRGGVRGTFALRGLAPGDVIAKIPLGTAALWLGPPDTANMRVLAARLLRAAADRSDPRAPWFAALPMLRRARLRSGGAAAANAAGDNNSIDSATSQLQQLQLHAETFPPEYLHLLASPARARHIADTQADTAAYWAARGFELASHGFDIEDLRAAAVAVATRYMSVPHRGKAWPIMVPLLDMANHRDNCANWYEFRGCSDALPPWPRSEAAWRAATEGSAGDAFERSELCAFWFAGAPVEAGGEACLSYGYLAPDVALFQYGFLPPDDGGLALMDRPDYAEAGGGHTHAAPQREFDGDAAALAAELKRITALLDTLTSTQPAARATKAAPPRDGSGEWLAQILELRERRMAALAAEQARLRRRLAEVDAAGGTSGSPEAASRAEQQAQKGEL